MEIESYQDFYNEISKRWGGDDYKIGMLAWHEATARQQKKIEELEHKLEECMYVRDNKWGQQ